MVFDIFYRKSKLILRKQVGPSRSLPYLLIYYVRVCLYNGCRHCVVAGFRVGQGISVAGRDGVQVLGDAGGVLGRLPGAQGRRAV